MPVTRSTSSLEARNRTTVATSSAIATTVSTTGWSTPTETSHMLTRTERSPAHTSAGPTASTYPAATVSVVTRQQSRQTKGIEIPIGGDIAPPQGTYDSSKTVVASKVPIGGDMTPPQGNYESGGALTAPPRRTRSVKTSTGKAKAEARYNLALRELEVAKAALALLESEEEDDESELKESTHVEEWVDRTIQAHDEDTPLQVVNNENKGKSELKELAEAIIQASRNNPVSSVPQPSPPPPKYMHELPAFDGSCEEWLPFRKMYEDTAGLFSDVQNMARLRKAITGTAREAVKSLLFITSNPKEVMSTLERRFGRPDILVMAEIKKIKNLPRLTDSPKDMYVFASQINNTVATIKALKKPQFLYSPELAGSIFEKFTHTLRYRWYDFNKRRDPDGCNETPELEKINRFLNEEADLCGTYAPPELTVSDKKPVVTRTRVNAVRHEEPNVKTIKHVRKHCPMCNEEHWLNECERYKQATVPERWEIVKKHNMCFLCVKMRHRRMNCRNQRCRKCNKTHHVSLHLTAPPSVIQQEITVQQEVENPIRDVVSSVCAATSTRRAYLKMVPVEIYGPKGSVRVLALMDEGSTVSLLDSTVAASLGAKGIIEPLLLETVGGNGFKKTNSMRLELKIRGLHRTDKKTLTGVRTIDKLELSPQSIDSGILESCDHLRTIANKLMYEREKPKLLIGQDNWNLIVSRKIIKGKATQPVASLTSLGWVLHGCCTGVSQPVHFLNHCRCDNDNEGKLEEMIRNHFSVESLGIQPRRPSTDAEGKALAILQNTSRRLPGGRFETGLLWARDDIKLPNNYHQALKRLTGIERKLDRNEELKKEYRKQIQHLLDSGYAEEAPPKPATSKLFYLPHFAVVHPTKKKVRIVFDAAARFEGKCLNDALLSGPDLLRSLFGVLLRFRQSQVAVVADIKEMFLQIKIREEDRDSLRFLWRDDKKNEPPKEYRMTSVIFGAASSPSTAIYIKNKNASEYKKQYPEAAKAIVHNHYMDDYLQSFTTEYEAIIKAKQVNFVHKKAGFELRGWTSNRENVLRNVTQENMREEVQIGQEREEKTLGLRWRVKEDVLTFNFSLRNTPSEVIEGARAPTKREVTSAVMSTFDPMGLASPVLIKGKKLIQEIWRTVIKWDEVIEEGLDNKWKAYLGDLETLKNLKIPRCLTITTEPGELHTFIDASETAYAAVTNWRTIDTEGNIHVTLVAGKARVTPNKPISMPRLELRAALLGSRLTTTIKEDIVLIVDPTFPRNSWPKGEVVETYPGPDGRTRVIDVRTSGGVVRRPSSRVVVLVSASSLTSREKCEARGGEC